MGNGPLPLIERTFRFALEARRLVNRLPRTPATMEDARQLVRATGSVAANYLEAQEGVSRKDFFFRIKICRKEARESGLWLRLIEVPDPTLAADRDRLGDEASQLTRIFAKIASREE